MRTVTWKSVVSGVFSRPALAVPTDVASLNATLEYVTGRLRTAWEFYKWPELVPPIESRFFRDEWAAQSYDAGDEVYRDGSYWRASANTTSADVPGEFGSKGVLLAGIGIALAYSADGDTIIYTGTGPVDSKWVELVRFKKWVPFEQTGQTKMGAILGAWTNDPTKTTAAAGVSYQLMGEGVVFPPDYTPDRVWIAFRLPTPSVAPVVYDADVVYDAGDAVYIAPAAYDVLEETTAGENPTTAPAKFSEIPFPAWLAAAVKEGAYADLLEADSKSEKAARAEAKFQELLEEQVWQLTKLQGQTESLS